MPVYKSQKGDIEVGDDGIVKSRYGNEFKTAEGNPWLHVGFVMPNTDIEKDFGADIEERNWFSSEYRKNWHMLLFDSAQRGRVYDYSDGILSTKKYAGSGEKIRFYFTGPVTR